jgi:hypothetical protein
LCVVFPQHAVRCVKVTVWVTPGNFFLEIGAYPLLHVFLGVLRTRQTCQNINYHIVVCCRQLLHVCHVQHIGASPQGYCASEVGFSVEVVI